jgi:hypothetical protein
MVRDTTMNVSQSHSNDACHAAHYVQASVAVPLTGCDEVPRCRLCGAVPAMVAVPGTWQVAAPLSSMVAIVMSDVDHTIPSDELNARVDPLLRVPVWELLIAVPAVSDMETLVR